MDIDLPIFTIHKQLRSPKNNEGNRILHKVPTKSVRPNNNDVEFNLGGHFRWAGGQFI